MRYNTTPLYLHDYLTYSYKNKISHLLFYGIPISSKRLEQSIKRLLHKRGVR